MLDIKKSIDDSRSFRAFINCTRATNEASTIISATVKVYGTNYTEEQFNYVTSLFYSLKAGGVAFKEGKSEKDTPFTKSSVLHKMWLYGYNKEKGVEDE